MVVAALAGLARGAKEESFELQELGGRSQKHWQEGLLPQPDVWLVTGSGLLGPRLLGSDPASVLSLLGPTGNTAMVHN